MRKRLTGGIVAAVVASAMVPGVGLANQGGTPHSTTPCPAHSNHGKHKGQQGNATKGKRKGSMKGKKCGSK